MAPTTDIEQRLREAEAERDALKAYARKATATITELHGGGSECFAGKIGDMYVADLAFCKQQIRERDSKAHIRFVDATKRLRAARSKLEEAEAALEPFALVAEYGIGDSESDEDIFRPMDGRNSVAGLVRVGHLRAASRTLASLREADHA